MSTQTRPRADESDEYNAPREIYFQCHTPVQQEVVDWCCPRESSMFESAFLPSVLGEFCFTIHTSNSNGGRDEHPHVFSLIRKYDGIFSILVEYNSMYVCCNVQVQYCTVCLYVRTSTCTRTDLPITGPQDRYHYEYTTTLGPWSMNYSKSSLARVQSCGACRRGERVRRDHLGLARVG